MLKTHQTHEQKVMSSNGIATLNIPRGGKLHSIALRFTTAAGADATEAQIRAEIGQVRLTLNGKDLVNAPIGKILDLYEALGQNVNDASAIAGVVELNLGKLIYTDPAVRDLFGLGTADVTSIQISVTAGTLSQIANVQAFTSREAKEENLGMYFKFINYAVSFNAATDHTLDTLPRDPDSSYVAVLCDMGASGVLATGEVRVNGVTFKERIPRSINALSLSNDRMAQPSGYYVYAFTDGNLKSRLPMVGVNDLRLINGFTTAPGASGYNASVLTVVNLPANA